MEPLDSADPRLPRGTLRELSDPALWKVSGFLGRTRLHADRKFLAAVAEIARRGLIETKRRFRSIEEYAAKVGGVSGETVAIVLRLARAFEAYPRTWEVFAAGRVGWTCLRIVASHLQQKTDAQWASLLDRATRKNLEDMVAGWRQPVPTGETAAAPGGSRPGPRAGVGPAVPVPGDGSRPLGSAPVAADTVPGPGSPTARADRPEAPRAPAGLVLPPELLARLEGRRAVVERKLGHPLDLSAFLGLLLDATAARSAEAPAVPRKVLPGQPSGEHIQVIFKEAERGRLFRRSRQGLEPVPIAEQLLTLGEPLASYQAETLEAEARASAAASRGREPPPVVARWVWLRSGGRCEREGCGRRGEQLHHETRRADQFDHSPEKLAIECLGCHHATHVGLLDQDGGFTSGAATQRLGFADQAYLARWQAARQPWG